jgi:hypothetical protein
VRVIRDPIRAAVLFADAISVAEAVEGLGISRFEAGRPRKSALAGGPSDQPIEYVSIASPGVDPRRAKRCGARPWAAAARHCNGCRHADPSGCRHLGVQRHDRRDNAWGIPDPTAVYRFSAIAVVATPDRGRGASWIALTRSPVRRRTFIWGLSGTFNGVPITIAILIFCGQHPSGR